ANADLWAGSGLEQHVYARAELDQSHALASLQAITHFRMENDAARQQSGDLLEDDHLSIAFHRDYILLVLLGRCRIHGIQIFAALVADLAHNSCDRRPVHVHIENAEEDTDADLLLAVQSHSCDLRDFAISRRYNGACGIRNSALRVAKEPQKKDGQQQRRQSPGRLSHPADDEARHHPTEPVEVAVTNHGE